MGGSEGEGGGSDSSNGGGDGSEEGGGGEGGSGNGGVDGGGGDGGGGEGDGEGVSKRQEHSWQPLLSTTFPCSHHRVHSTSGQEGQSSSSPPPHCPQVSAQLRWYQGWLHLCFFASQKLVGLMSPHGGAGGGGMAGGDGAAAHWPQVIAQLAWR